MGWGLIVYDTYPICSNGPYFYISYKVQDMFYDQDHRDIHALWDSVKYDQCCLPQ